MKILLICILWGFNALGQNYQNFDQEILANIIYDNSKYPNNSESFKIYKNDTSLFMYCKIDTITNSLKEVNHSYNLDESLCICIKYLNELDKDIYVQKKEVENPYILDGVFYNPIGIQSVKWNYKEGKIDSIEFKHSDGSDKINFCYDEGFIKGVTFYRGNIVEHYSITWK